MLAQLTLPDFAGSQFGLWLMSIYATQCLLFWKYLFLWYLPNPDWMSVLENLRVDFEALWAGWAGYAVALGVILSFAVVGLAVWVWWQRGVATLGGQLATAFFSC